MQYLITWETYTLRRQIKWFGWFWNKENKWWVITTKTENLDKFISDNDLEIKEIQEEIKKADKIDILIDRAKRKIEQYKNRSSKASENFKKEEDKFSTLTHWHDYAFITQPCNWHRWMIKAKENMEKTMEKRYWDGWYYDQEKEADSKLEYWTKELKRLEDKKSWKWENAEAIRNKLIAEKKATLKVWDFVKTCRGAWKIIKMNIKTCRIEWIGYPMPLQFID